jgi:hypothetical protein
MPTETLVAFLVFGGLLVISVVGYWISSRRADALDRRKSEPPRTTVDRVDY